MPLKLFSIFITNYSTYQTYCNTEDQEAPYGKFFYLIPVGSFFKKSFFSQKSL